MTASGQKSGAATPFRIPKRTYTRYLGVLNAADGDPAAARALAPSFSLAESTFDEIHAMTHAATHASADADDDGHGAERAIELVYEPYTEAEDRILIDMSFAAMSDTEVRIVELKYAFTEYEEQTDAEIAHRMGMSRPTVQRRHSKALDKARKALGVTQDSE